MGRVVGYPLPKLWIGQGRRGTCGVGPAEAYVVPTVVEPVELFGATRPNSFT